MISKTNELERCLIPRGKSVDVKSFKILFFRSNHILLGLTILSVLLYLVLFDQEFYSFLYDSINYKEQLYSQFLEHKKNMISLYGEGSFNTTFQQFLNEMKDTYINDLITLLIMSFVIILPWLLYLFWPQQCPVRVDKERNLIYTWSWGKLYAARFDDLNPKKQETAHFLEVRGGWGPLVISLYPAGLNKAKRVSIGSYIPKFNYQNHQLLGFIKNYLNGFTTMPSDFKPERGFLEKTLVKDRSFPQEQKLNKAIDEWLEHKT
ncbi:hypothetical protein [Kangiella marina]|uniref:Uncharacterized protein n=1 Tax=Kangiella marina TaxID=1079178 RepID=A0ABP8IJ00_9GAMM